VTKEYAWWPIHGGGVFVHTAREAAEAVLLFAKDTKAAGEQVNKQEEFLGKSFSNSGRSAEAVVDTMLAEGKKNRIIFQRNGTQ
jgi:hypothetical protein